MSRRRRYAIVGTGSRAGLYIDGISGTYRETAELVALCDLSQARMDWHNRRLVAQEGGAPRPTYPAESFDRMIADTAPDTVIVTTVDATHHQYIVRAMELGRDVITEKPMTTDAEKMRAIFDAIARTGRSLRVAFNYRYAPAYTTFRRLMMDGVVGRPLLVDFSWLLDTQHGADYFRRWHRERKHSGGLLVHKATHHFDLVNWWIDAYPARGLRAGGARVLRAGERRGAGRVVLLRALHRERGGPVRSLRPVPRPERGAPRPLPGGRDGERVHPGPERVRRADHHRRHDGGDGALPERRAPVLLPGRLCALGGPAGRRDRRPRPARDGHRGKRHAPDAGLGAGEGEQGCVQGRADQRSPDVRRGVRGRRARPGRAATVGRTR